jgi:hypothetical protein
LIAAGVELPMVGYFFMLLVTGLELLIYLWPVTLALVIWTVVAWSKTIGRRPNKGRGDLLWSICPLACALVILIVGCALAQAGIDAAAWPLKVWLVQFVGSIALVIRARGSRAAFAAMFTLELWVSYCMAAAAGMAISDKWV